MGTRFHLRSKTAALNVQPLLDGHAAFHTAATTKSHCLADRSHSLLHILRVNGVKELLCRSVCRYKQSWIKSIFRLQLGGSHRRLHRHIFGYASIRLEQYRFRSHPFNSCKFPNTNNCTRKRSSAAGFRNFNRHCGDNGCRSYSPSDKTYE
jgi:hypothetical protein